MVFVRVLVRRDLTRDRAPSQIGGGGGGGMSLPGPQRVTPDRVGMAAIRGAADQIGS